MIIPAILSIIFSLGLVLLAIFLLYSTLRSGESRPALEEQKTPDAKLGPVSASRWLRYFRILFVGLCITVLGFHAYWAFFTEGPLGEDEAYRTMKDSRDQRNRRLQEAGLRGWVFDRHESIDSALIRYKLEGQSVVRDYPLDEAGAHLIGYKSLLRG